LNRDPLTDDIWQRVIQKVYVLKGLSSEELAQLRELTTLFVHQKKFYGTYELEIDDYIRVAVGAQACLLVLNISPEWDLHIFPGWVSIILYPGPFVARHNFRDGIGVVHEQIAALEGEASAHGPVVLSWHDARPGASLPREGRNVVLHEFAHKLDFLTGVSNGCPPLHKGMSVKDWSNTFQKAFDHLNHLIELHHPTPFNPYAGTNPAEFFAVMTEEFFIVPHRLKDVYPGVYEQMSLYYQQDPASRRRRVSHIKKRFRG